MQRVVFAVESEGSIKPLRLNEELSAACQRTSRSPSPASAIAPARWCKAWSIIATVATRRSTASCGTTIGGYRASDVEFVAAFDVDKRKVGRPLEEAIFAKPNNTRVFQSSLPVSNVVVQMGPQFDGVAAHMADYRRRRRLSFGRPRADRHRRRPCASSGAEVLLCYLPVGSEQAVKHYAQACLDAGVAMVNCVPVFLASDPEWAQKFLDAGLPIVGDDVKSQVGATIVHRTLARLFADRGVSLDRTYQLNTAGNTDFLNMLERKRLKSKKISKTESVQSQLDERLDRRATSTSVRPTTFRGSTTTRSPSSASKGAASATRRSNSSSGCRSQDSSNSAGVVVDAMRCAKLGLERGLAGPLEAPSAYYMKSPPRQFRDSVAHDACNAFIDGEPFNLPGKRAEEREESRAAVARSGLSRTPGLAHAGRRSKRSVRLRRHARRRWRGVEGPFPRPLPGGRTGHDRRGFCLRLLRRRRPAGWRACRRAAGLPETVRALGANLELSANSDARRTTARARPERCRAFPV